MKSQVPVSVRMELKGSNVMTVNLDTLVIHPCRSVICCSSLHCVQAKYQTVRDAMSASSNGVMISMS